MNEATARARALFPDGFADPEQAFEAAFQAGAFWQSGLAARTPGPAPLAWSSEPPSETDRFLADVKHELERARTKFPGRRIMLIALAEEFGELAKALLDESAASVRKEAIQTAVMAARVAIDGDESVDGWRSAKGLDFVGPLPEPAEPGEVEGE